MKTWNRWKRTLQRRNGLYRPLGSETRRGHQLRRRHRYVGMASTARWGLKPQMMLCTQNWSRNALTGGAEGGKR